MPTSEKRRTSRKADRQSIKEKRQEKQKEKDKEIQYNYEKRFIDGKPCYAFEFEKHIAKCQQMRKIIHAANISQELFAKEYLKLYSSIDVIDRNQYLAELIQEKRVLIGLDTLIMPQRVYMPPDMLWEIWGFLPASIKQVFRDLRHNRLITTYVKSINGKYKKNIEQMLYEISFDKLMKFARFGTPAKYYIKPSYRAETTFYDLVMSTSSPTIWSRQWYIIYDINEMIIQAYEFKQFDRMTALINSVLYVHGRFGKGYDIRMSIEDGDTIIS